MYSLITILFVASLLLRYAQRGNHPAQLGLISAISLALIGMATPVIWNWSRQYGSVGLLPSHYLSSSEISQFYFLFSLLSTGAILNGIVFIILFNSRDLKSGFSSKTGLRDVRNARLIPIIGALTLLLLIFGMGKSLLFNETYLDFSGSQTFLRAANAILPASIIALGFACFDSQYRKLNTSLLFFIFIIQASRGSRISLIVPLIVFLHLAVRSVSIFRRITFILVMLLSFQILVSLTFLARNTSSGLMKFPALFANAIETTIQVENLIPSLGRMLASISSWAPTVIASISESSSAVIIRNINPLIGTGTDSFAYSSAGIERLFPYTWIPLSSLGQIYGAFGGLTVLLVAFFISAMASLSLIPSKRSSSLSIYSLLAVATYIFQFPLFFQYSSRIWIRVLWFMTLLSCLHIWNLVKFKSKLNHHLDGG